MGTSKHVAILLTVALAGMLTAGQDQPTTSSQATARGPSNTRFASCILRITVDPAILPLNPETVSSLIHSPAVLLKAAHDVLSFYNPADLDRLNKPQDSGRSLLMIKWLSTAPAQMSSGARYSQRGQLGTDDEMMRVYGPRYMEQMMRSPIEEKKGEAKAGSVDSPAQQDSRAGTFGMGAAGAVEGMGGMGMGGMGVGGGVSGMGRRAAQAQGPSPEVRRSPGESDVAYRTRVAQIRSQQKALQEMESRSMGSTGGGMGGYGAGGIGMGGMGGMGGMMSGYGGMGFSGAPGAPQQDAGAVPSATIELQVNLPDTVPALADEFLKGIVRNLQDSLSQAHEAYRGDLQGWLDHARNQRRAAEAALDGMPEDPAVLQDVQRRLNTPVDLSALSPKMPLKDAVDLLKKSVEPPLNIVVLWSNLLDYVQVEPTTPINIDGMSPVRLGTALDLLVKGIPNRLGAGGPTWKIKDNVVVIGTVIALAETRDSGAKPKVETDAMSLAGQRSELMRRVQSLELDLAGLDARREAIGMQIAGVERRVKEKVSTDPVIYELEKLADIHRPTVVKNPEGRLVPVSTPEEQEKAIRAKIELANRREELSKQVGGGQLDEFNKELSRMAIDKAEKEAQLQIVRRQLDEVQRQLAQALTFDPEAARLRLAQETLDITARRVAELQTRLANLQPPMVTVIGAN